MGQDLPEKFEQLFEEADKTFDANGADLNALYERLLAGLKKFDPEEKNVELLWRTGKAAYKLSAIAESNGDNKTRKQYLTDGEKYVDKALTIDPESGDAHEWKAYICGKMSNMLSTKEKIVKGKEMQKHLEKAMELKPNSRDVRFAHGRWAMEVSALSWMERKIASALFGSVPEASYEDAIKSFEISKSLKASKSNGYYMGKCKIELKKYKEAIADLDEAVQVPDNDEEDKIIQKDLLALQKKYASYR